MRHKGYIQKIAIIGDKLSAGLISAMMSARLQGGNCEFDIFINARPALTDHIFARPNIRHVHQLLQITEADLREQAGAEVVMALPMSSDLSGPFMSPLGHYGYAMKGCDFQHYWCRAYKNGKAEALEHYNFALRLNRLDRPIVWSLDLEKYLGDCPQIDPGYKFHRQGYAKLLLKLAHEAGHVVIKEQMVDVNLVGNVPDVVSDSHSGNHKDTAYDLILHVSDDTKPDRSGRSGHYIQISPNAKLPGLYLYQIQSAIIRLFDLWPDKIDMSIQAQEYNRLLNAELQHIADMQCLIEKGEGGACDSRLRRKIDVFRNCGRIAFEDYDIFSNSEWIAAFGAAGVEMTEYDYLADKPALDEVSSWLEQMDAAMIAQIQNRFRGEV